MPEFILHIKDGQITNTKAVRKFFNALQDGKHLVKISSIKRRSLNQNSYLHGCVIPLVFEGLRAQGFDEVKTHEDAKEVIKSLFLKKVFANKNDGEVFETVRHTSELTTTEFNEFIEAVIKWGAEYLGIQIPFPNEQMTMEL